MMTTSSSSVSQKRDLQDVLDIKRRFSNHREWREFIKAVQDSVTYPSAATYPMLLGALRPAAAPPAGRGPDGDPVAT